MGSKQESQEERDELIDAYLVAIDRVAPRKIRGDPRPLRDRNSEASPQVAAVSAMIRRMLVVFLELVVRDRKDLPIDGNTERELERIGDSIDRLWKHLIWLHHQRTLAVDLVDLLVAAYKGSSELDGAHVEYLANSMYRSATGKYLSEREWEFLMEPPDPDVPDENEGPVWRATFRVGQLMGVVPETIRNYRKGESEERGTKRKEKAWSAYTVVDIDEQTIEGDLTSGILLDSLAELCFRCSFDDVVAKRERGKRKLRYRRKLRLFHRWSASQ